MSTLFYTLLIYTHLCHALEMMCAWQQPHTVLPSVAPNTMHMGTNRNAQ